MNIAILTLFPDMVEAGLSASILGRAREAGILKIAVINIRTYALNKHHSVDDYIYGGGAGMLMQADPIYRAYEAACQKLAASPRVLYTSPAGKLFSQADAKRLAGEDNLLLLCGHYEGVDERVLEELSAESYSVGDYVLTGGELPAMVMTDAIARFVPGVLHNAASAGEDSLSGNLLEHPQYSRPEVWHGRKVPEVLLSGHHARVEAWRREASLCRTAVRRPDLLAKASLTEEEREAVKKILENRESL